MSNHGDTLSVNWDGQTRDWDRGEQFRDYHSPMSQGVLMTRYKSIAALLALAAGPLAAQSVPVAPGAGNSNNCFPFTCAYAGEYQQVYDAGSFAATTTFDTVSFFKDQVNGNFGTGSFAVSFYYSNFGPDALLPDFVANRGALIGSFGSFALTGTELEPEFKLTGSRISYDPSKGSLLLDVNIVSLSSFGSAPLDAEITPGDAVSRVYTERGSNVVRADTTGLVTRFSLSPGPIPEPSTWALFIVGFGAVGGALRRSPRQRVVPLGPS